MGQRPFLDLWSRCITSSLDVQVGLCRDPMARFTSAVCLWGAYVVEVWFRNNPYPQTFRVFVNSMPFANIGTFQLIGSRGVQTTQTPGPGSVYYSNGTLVSGKAGFVTSPDMHPTPVMSTCADFLAAPRLSALTRIEFSSFPEHCRRGLVARPLLRGWESCFLAARA